MFSVIGFSRFQPMKIQDLANCDILMTITVGINMITRQLALVFSSTYQALSVGIFHVRVSRPSKFNFLASFSGL